jgi:hypothetical protein
MKEAISESRNGETGARLDHDRPVGFPYGADDRLKQPLGVSRRRRADNLEPKHVEEVPLHRLRVPCSKLVHGIAPAADHDRDVGLPARHVGEPRRCVNDLIERTRREVERHQLDHGAQADHRRADADAGESRLRDMRVDDAAAGRTR